MPNQEKTKADQERDEVLKRMLKMKPRPHDTQRPLSGRSRVKTTVERKEESTRKPSK